MARKKPQKDRLETSAPIPSQSQTISLGRYYLHPRDMTPEERFELITDIFAEAFIEQRLADVIAEMQAEAAVSKADKPEKHSQSSLEVSADCSPDGVRIR